MLVRIFTQNKCRQWQESYTLLISTVNGVLLSLQPNSHAYLAHVFKIMLLMIQFDCCGMLDRLIMNCNGSNLWNLMLPYLANIGMADVITALLFPPPNKRDVSSQTSDETIYKRVQCHIYLKSLGFIERLFELMRLEGRLERLYCEPYVPWFSWCDALIS
jgi:hypothetical protein